MRVVRHAPWSGLPALAVEKTSRASATQRAGRAGRTRPGRALRLYTKADFDARPEHETPEILRVDLAQTVLELAASGARARDVVWLDPPKADALVRRRGAPRSARSRRRRAAASPRSAGGCSRSRSIRGRRACSSRPSDAASATTAPCSRRSSASATSAPATKARFDQGGGGARALDVATETSDLLGLLDCFREAEDSSFAAHAIRAIGLDQGAVHAVERAQRSSSGASCATRTRRRRSRRRPPTRRCSSPCSRAFRIASRGASARARATSRSLKAAPPSSRRRARCATRRGWWRSTPSSCAGSTLVRVASGIEPEWLIELFEDRIREVADLSFDDAKGAVIGGSKMLYDALAIAESPGFDKNDPKVADLLFERAKARGARSLVASESLSRWLARARFAASQDKSLRAPTDEDVMHALRALCEGKTTLREVEEGDLLGTLRSEIGSLAKIDELAPERVKLASGRSARDHVRGGQAALDRVLPPGLLRHEDEPARRTHSDRPPPSRAQQARRPGDDGPRGVLGAALSGDPEGADAEVPPARVAGGDGDCGADEAAAAATVGKRRERAERARARARGRRDAPSRAERDQATRERMRSTPRAASCIRPTRLPSAAR